MDAIEAIENARGNRRVVETSLNEAKKVRGPKRERISIRGRQGSGRVLGATYKKVSVAVGDESESKIHGWFQIVEERGTELPHHPMA
jgi:hypothetical protein